jgi:two-component system, NarL family, nitrate/nitrite response regulator NarL
VVSTPQVIAQAVRDPGDRSSAHLHDQDDKGREPLRVLIVSDVKFFRDGLAEVLSQHADVVVATAEDPEMALAQTLATIPDAILLDVALPSGLAAVASIAASAPDIPIIALALTETEQTVLTWAEAGVTSYVPRSASIVDLIGTVTLAVRGEQSCSTKIAGAMLRRLRQLAIIAKQYRSPFTDARLTRREREIAELIADGLSNKLIARKLNIGVATAKCHVHNILEKLKLHRRSDVAHWLRQLELCP